MQAFLQILHEQYYTGTWQTRECYPWEYEIKAQECIQLASHSDNNEWFLQQAKILQDRANYIRQKWVTQHAAQQAVAQQVTQLAALQATLQATLQVAQQSTPPASERQSAQSITKPIAQKEKEQEPQSLHQATVEDIAESTAEKQIGQHDIVTSKPDNNSTLSTIPRPDDTPFSGDPAACLSNALLFACQHTAFLACLRHGFLPGYIEWIEGMEATGQG